jgi:Fic family protein
MGKVNLSDMPVSWNGPCRFHRGEMTVMSFRGRRLQAFVAPTSTVWLWNDIAEGKGRQDLYTRQSPHILRALREQALIQSAESSNRIEGVTVEPGRLGPLIIGNVRPRDRSEEEVQNYRRALDQIHSRANELPVNPDVLRLLHRTAQEGAGDAGEWKRVNNDIVELRPGQAPSIRFRTVAFGDAPAATAELCQLYAYALEQEKAPALLAAAALVLDFLCIHPFRDGNGRVSRLLTLLVLYHHGYEVGRYVSLERLIEETCEEYYEALRRSSQDWHEGRHDLVPWLNYYLSVVYRAYKAFEERAGQVKSPRGAKADLVLGAIRRTIGPFRIADLQQACPGVSVDWIRQILKGLRAEGKVECLGRGHQAQWRKRGPWELDSTH